MNTYIENDIQATLAEFLIPYPVENIEGNFDAFLLGNVLDGNDIFGEIDDQDNGVEIKEHVPDKHENDYLECDFNFLSEQRCIEDFDLNLLNQNTAKAEEIQYSMPMNYQVKIETERFYAGQYAVDSHWQMSADVPVLKFNIYSPISSPCPSDISTSSSSASFNSLSSSGPQIKSKRGRKPKDWDNSNVIRSMMQSAKNSDELNKTKNNISSGKYRKRKAMERKELDRKITLLEIRNQKLNERIQKNKLWFDSVRMLFPDIKLPW